MDCAEQLCLTYGMGDEHRGDSFRPKRGVDDNIFDPCPHACRGGKGDERETCDKEVAVSREEQVCCGVRGDQLKFGKRWRRGTRKLREKAFERFDMVGGWLEDPFYGDQISGHR